MHKNSTMILCNFVHTSRRTRAIIMSVNPPIHYSFCYTQKEIPSPKRAAARLLFSCASKGRVTVGMAQESVDKMSEGKNADGVLQQLLATPQGCFINDN